MIQALRIGLVHNLPIPIVALVGKILRRSGFLSGIGTLWPPGKVRLEIDEELDIDICVGILPEFEWVVHVLDKKY